MPFQDGGNGGGGELTRMIRIETKHHALPAEKRCPFSRKRCARTGDACGRAVVLHAGGDQGKAIAFALGDIDGA